jgi:DeoR/GlpR family transcriptional regulator of sugar metabolism
MAAPQLRREEPPYSVRVAADSAAKQRIGQLAASLVTTGQTVVFDVGTSVLAVARALPANFSGVAVTCSLVAAGALATRPGVQVLIAGGRVRPGDLAVSNAHTVAFFEEIHADVAFLGSGCVSADEGLTDFYVDEIATRCVIIANTATNYVLADSSKLGKVARIAFAESVRSQRSLPTRHRPNKWRPNSARRRATSCIPPTVRGANASKFKSGSFGGLFWVSGT